MFVFFPLLITAYLALLQISLSRLAAKIISHCFVGFQRSRETAGGIDHAGSFPLSEPSAEEMHRPEKSNMLHGGSCWGFLRFVLAVDGTVAAFVRLCVLAARAVILQALNAVSLV